MKMNFENLATGIVVACALVMTTLSISRAKLASSAVGPATRASVELDAAMMKRLETVTLGDMSVVPEAVVTEFIDLECPFCSAFSHSIDTARSQLHDTLQIRFVNLPISSHRFARTGAVAVECAFELGIGRKFIETSYRLQDSIGYWSWRRMASEAGATDTLRFATCMKDPQSSARVDSAIAVARELGIRATPTVLVGAQRLSVPPSAADLVRLVRKGKAFAR
jgi:protein-disulfide isomerase